MNQLATIQEGIHELQQGNMLIVIDSPDRENQGDLIFAAESATAERITFLLNKCRGMICVPITKEKARQLDLPLMVSYRDNTEQTSVNFTVTVDAHDVTDYGISAADRALTIRTIADQENKPTELVRPGHIFPLLARDGGILERDGHTEATIDLIKLAGLNPVGVLCEILNEKGDVANLAELFEFARENNIKIVSILDLMTHMEKHKSEMPPHEVSDIIKKASAHLPTNHANFHISVFTSVTDRREHVALTYGDIQKSPVLVRVHSQCLTGDTLESLRCDCREQLHESMKQVKEAGAGIIIYLNQEGRGIGLTNKIKAYALQEEGHDTFEANKLLGLPADGRNYKIAADILKNLGITTIDLLTNNPEKEQQLQKYGIKINKRISLEVKPNKINKQYLKTKKERFGHKLTQV